MPDRDDTRSHCDKTDIDNRKSKISATYLCVVAFVGVSAFDCFCRSISFLLLLSEYQFAVAFCNLCEDSFVFWQNVIVEYFFYFCAMSFFVKMAVLCNYMLALLS